MKEYIISISIDLENFNVEPVIAIVYDEVVADLYCSYLNKIYGNDLITFGYDVKEVSK